MIVLSYMQNKSSCLSLYIHFPWCLKKCPYCDFNSHVTPDRDEQRYIDCLMRDLETEQALIQDRPIQSIFMGGGTPSLFSGAAISDLLTRLSNKLNFMSPIEITLEANPGTVEQSYFRSYFNAGVNRLSLGIQSFQDQALKKLGRIHRSIEAKRAIETAHQIGFKQINLDLMHGLPAQSPDEALSDLKTALEFDPDHLSWYQLTLEPNTYFSKHPPKLPSERSLDKIETLGLRKLNAAGYERYEISAYAKNQNYCQHNVNYWTFGDYIGIGAGSHGKYRGHNHILRRSKKKMPRSYLACDKNFIAQETKIFYPETCYEYMLNRLRYLKPFSIQTICDAVTGCTSAKLKSILDPFVQKKLIAYTEQGAATLEDTFEVTTLGQKFLNELIQAFDPQSEQMP